MFSAIPFSVLFCVFHQLSFASHLDKTHKNNGKLFRHENFTYDLILFSPGLGFFYTSPLLRSYYYLLLLIVVRLQFS